MSTGAHISGSEIDSFSDALQSSAYGTVTPEEPLGAGERAVGPPVAPEKMTAAKRRRFHPNEKVRILAEADGCQQRGELRALLHREGIDFTMLCRWRRQRDQAAEIVLMLQNSGSQRRYGSC